ncbi:MAG TPA: HD domain-containing phosphohydrolase, partial [Thermodesulfovibrionales bacterium]|nr:HD domain-containing phosphohydrolase [Thermodesulfovibrionales bacterium]
MKSEIQNPKSKIVRVLLIEDNPGDARLIEEMLKHSGAEYELQWAERLSTGIELLKANGFDVILLDLGLPDSRVPDTLRKLSAIESKAPVIVLTGLADEAIGAQAVKEGAQDYLIKGQIDKNLLVRSITYAIERRKAEDLLRQSEEKYRNLVERARDGIVIIQDETIKFANARMAELDGGRVEQLVGSSFTDHVHPSELPRIVDMYRRRMAGEKLPDMYEAILLRKDGSSAPAELSAGIITYDGRPADLVIIRDITERKRAEQLIEEQKRFSENLIESSAVATFVVDRQHKVMSWNKACEELTGMPASEMLGTDNQWKPFYEHKRPVLADIVIEADFDRLSGLYAVYSKSTLAPNALHAEGWYRNLNGKDRYILFDAAPIFDSKGELIAAIENLQDITDRKKTEEMLQRSEASYREATIILGESIENIKKREAGILRGRDAFLNMLDDVNEAYKELTLAYEKTIEGWSRALDYRDKETEGHSQRVTELTIQIAREMGMGEEELLHVRRGALLHDIGKMGIPDAILHKKGRLTEEEMVIIRNHPKFAYDMLKEIDYLQAALEIPFCHHEKWDGTGYPRGLKGEEIPIAARIFAIVDVWDAMTHDRPYRKAIPCEEVIPHLTNQSGQYFDPNVVDV